MHEELDPIDGATTLDADSESVIEEDRAGCELINGKWVPKHPAEMPPDDDRAGCELIDGVWVEKPMSTTAGIVESNLNFAVKGHVRANRLGFVFSESAMYQLFAAKPKQVRRPDVSFVRFGRLPDDKVPAGKMQLAPDLAVEVISPTDIAEDVETKLDEYLRAGVRLVWVVYVPTKNVWAYKADGTAKLYRSGDSLPGEDVLPGFGVPVAEVFEGV
ncbi:MAG: Uma2 family endonuclease [Planctomycetia bacterium]|nr:Uma2 family endonuclease [Planctomycetia bacterium]